MADQNTPGAQHNDWGSARDHAPLQQQQEAQAQHPVSRPDHDTDGLKNKKPEELTPEELRLMADTMPGEGPGD
jgi:hypothetical protein